MKYLKINFPKSRSEGKPQPHSPFFFVFLPVYLDGLKSRDELYNEVFEDIHNKLLNCS